MFDLILRAPLAAITHEERAYLAEDYPKIHERFPGHPPQPTELHVVQGRDFDIGFACACA